jgi:hypothetical protein
MFDGFVKVVRAVRQTVYPVSVTPDIGGGAFHDRSTVLPLSFPMSNCGAGAVGTVEEIEYT